MRQRVGSFTLDAPLILRDQLGGKEGDFVAICGADAVQIQWLTDNGGGEAQLVEPGDRLVLPLEDKNQITVSSPTEAYPLTFQMAIDREGVGYESPHVASSDLAALVAAEDAFKTATAYESTYLTLAANSEQSSAQAYAQVDSVEVAVVVAPLTAGYLTIADAGGKAFATVALITGLLNFMVPLPRPLTLKTAGAIQFTATVAVSVIVSITGN